MNKKILAIIISVLGLLSAYSFSYAYAVDNNCNINIIHILQLRISLGCIEDRLDALENAPSGSGNSTILNDLGDVVISSPLDTQLLTFNSTTNVWENINATRLGQNVIIVSQSQVKTNIGTTYVDVYTTIFDQEEIAVIYCGGISQFNIQFQWDYVGTGTQNARWVDVNNNANILFESSGFTSDVGSTSGWFDKPSWCTNDNLFFIEQQAKSTVGTDDPVFKQYRILTR